MLYLSQSHRFDRPVVLGCRLNDHGAMKSYLLCLLLTSNALSAEAWFWPFKATDPTNFSHEHVKSLDVDSFESNVLREDGRFYFAKFYAPWCGHCKTLAPIWGQLAEENTSSDVEFVQVDCTRNRKLCDKAAIKGFPEIKVFYNGRIGLGMRGGKDLAGMRQYIKDALPKVKENHAKALEHEAKQDDKATSPPSHSHPEL